MRIPAAAPKRLSAPRTRAAGGEVDCSYRPTRPAKRNRHRARRRRSNCKHFARSPLANHRRPNIKQERIACVVHNAQLASQPPLAGRVHFLGNRHDVAQLLSECTALVHAARQEPLGRVLLEAAACGTAVVATDVGGTREIFPLDWRRDLSAARCRCNRQSRTTAVRRRTTPNNAGSSVRRRAESAFEIGAAAQRLITVYQETGTGVIS